jgi:hypothetical protein
MDRDQIDNISRHTPIGRRGGLVRGQVRRVQNVAGQFILQGREKPKIRIRDPFELRLFTEPIHHRRALAAPAPRKQGYFKTRGCDDGAIAFGGRQKLLIAIVEDIDVRGKPRPIPIECDPARHITVGAALARQEAQEMRLELTERHGTTAQDVQPAAFHPLSHKYEAPA